jgi:hypothetical protein
MFSDVSKSTLLTNNGLNAVLGPLLGGPDRGLSLYFIRMKTISYFISSFIPSTFHTKKSEFHTIINIFIQHYKFHTKKKCFHTIINIFIRMRTISYLHM